MAFPEPGTLLTNESDDSAAVVVDPDDWTLEEVKRVLDEVGASEFTIEEFSSTVTFQVWRSYLKRQREEIGWFHGDYWGADGDGNRLIAVAVWQP